MPIVRLFLLCLILSAGLSACANLGANEIYGKELQGISGNILGEQARSKLGERGLFELRQALFQALKTNRGGEIINWQSPVAGKSGQISLGPAYQVNKAICRKYSLAVQINEISEMARGTACHVSDGSWHITS